MRGRNFIKAHWDAQAEAHGSSHEASWGDRHAIALEIETIGKHISRGNQVLDVGCANGYSAFRQLETHGHIAVTGIDFSVEMIRRADAEKKRTGLGNRIHFIVGDVRALGFPDARFDVVYTTRTLINLPTWEEQKRGILECMRVVRKGGAAVFSEAFWEPLALLNALRAIRQLPPLVEHDFNRYLKKGRLEEWLRAEGFSYYVEDFSSLYYVGSRFLRELVTDPGGYPGYTNPVNEAFFHLEKEFSGGGFGIQQAYVVTK